MRQTQVLDLEDAELMLDAAAEHATANDWKASLAVVDESGCLIAFKKLNGATISSVTTAIKKARSAARTKRPTRFFDEMVAAGRIGASMIHGVFPVEGGLPTEVHGETVGGFGVRGLRSGLDIVLVKAGLSALEQSRDRSA